ncbi:GNAT family N-acetyltransferase [Streptacidiphilus sp. EB129]|uniref:GNAT family N-acetyltransferase n=1 Tax=Streptacidiphilus sp. EB129 TaxID=3156262 RepID=UPI0035140C49
MEIRVVGYAHPDAQRLIAEVQQEYVVRYGGDGDASPVDPAEFEPPHGLFAVLYDADGSAVGTGAWRARDAEQGEPGLADGDAELKRMYTAPAARGRGLARGMLRYLEADARRAGRRRMVLETGARQPEALALYAAEGYLPTTKFGIYQDEPLSVCLAKELPPLTAEAAAGSGEAAVSGQADGSGEAVLAGEAVAVPAVG